MSKIYFSIVILSLLLVSCAPKNKQVASNKETFNYNIKLNIEGLRGPAILLDRVTNKPVNTVYSRSTEFEIKGELPIEKMHSNYVIHFPSKYSNPYFYPVAEACAINFKMDTLTTVKAHYDSLLYANVKNDYENAIKEFKKKNLPKLVVFEKENMASFVRDREEAPEKQKAFAKKMNTLMKSAVDQIIDKVGEFKNNEIITEVVSGWGGNIGIEKLDSLAKLLDKKLHTTPGYKNIIAVLEYMKKQKQPKKLKVGQMAPNFKLKSLDNKEVALSDSKGNYVILDFWASWCGPCEREMPFMIKLYEKYKSKGLKMIGISTDKTESAWKKALAKLKPTYLQVIDKKGIASNKYYVRGIPYVLLIDKAGKIMAIERGEELEKRVEKIFK